MTFARMSTIDDAGASSPATSAKASSPTIRSRPSAAPAWSRFRTCRALLQYICEQGFEHHVAANLSIVAGVVEEAWSKYMGWDVYRHS